MIARVHDDARSTTTVAELRLRLYRPEPPADAVAAYLTALAAAGLLAAADPVRAPRPPHRRGRALGALVAIACAAAAVAAAVLIGRQASTLLAAPAAADAATGRDASRGVRLAEPPLIGEPLGDLFSAGRTSGRFTANGHRVAASVLCTGTGTLEVRIADEPPTTLACTAGPAAFAIVASTAALDRFTIVVTADGPIRWSLAACALQT